MNKHEFEFGMNRLTARWSVKDFPPEVEGLIAKRLMVLSAKQFNDIIDKIFEEEKFAPTANDIVKYALPYLNEHYKTKHLERVRAIDERKENGEVCRWCGDEGEIFFLIRENKYSGVAKCPDVNCFASNHVAPTWMKRWEDSFYEKAIPDFYDKSVQVRELADRNAEREKTREYLKIMQMPEVGEAPTVTNLWKMVRELAERKSMEAEPSLEQKISNIKKVASLNLIKPTDPDGAA